MWPSMFSAWDNCRKHMANQFRIIKMLDGRALKLGLESSEKGQPKGAALEGQIAAVAEGLHALSLWRVLYFYHETGRTKLINLGYAANALPCHFHGIPSKVFMHAGKSVGTGACSACQEVLYNDHSNQTIVPPCMCPRRFGQRSADNCIT
jgi:hypothetical protein